MTLVAFPYCNNEIFPLPSNASYWLGRRIFRLWLHLFLRYVAYFDSIDEGESWSIPLNGPTFHIYNAAQKIVASDKKRSGENSRDGSFQCLNLYAYRVVPCIYKEREERKRAGRTNRPSIHHQRTSSSPDRLYLEAGLVHLNTSRRASLRFSSFFFILPLYYRGEGSSSSRVSSSAYTQFMSTSIKVWTTRNPPASPQPKSSMGRQ